MRTFYCLVMDERINPLRALPTAQRFQAMLFLSVMWTTIFCAIAGVWFWYGALVIVLVVYRLIDFLMKDLPTYLFDVQYNTYFCDDSSVSAVSFRKCAASAGVAKRRRPDGM